MPFDASHHHRRSIRLPLFDYAQPGAYFVTICTHDRASLFGEVEGDAVRLSPAGEIVWRCWEALPVHFPRVVLDAFVVMPNHVHGIIGIVDDGARADRRGLINQTPTTPDEHSEQWILMKARGDSLGKVVRSFNARATRFIRMEGLRDFAWQRNYWERVLRDERELDLARRYIRDNPLRWHLDRLCPEWQPDHSGRGPRR